MPCLEGSPVNTDGRAGEREAAEAKRDAAMSVILRAATDGYLSATYEARA